MGDGIIVGVDVNARVGVKLPVAGKLVDVEAGCGEGDAEAGVCPLWDRLQANVVRTRIIGMK